MVLDLWLFFFGHKSSTGNFPTLEKFPAEKYLQIKKIANRTKCNTFFEIRKCIPDPHYTRIKFLADMSYTCHHKSKALILLFKYILA